MVELLIYYKMLQIIKIHNLLVSHAYYRCNSLQGQA